MSQTIEQYKEDKEQLRAQIAKLLTDFCTKYNAVLVRADAVQLARKGDLSKPVEISVGVTLQL